MKCKTCNIEIPNVRVSLGYKECVNCSSTEAVGCVDIVYHKTGNDIQIMSKQQAQAVNKHKRRGFGTMLKGGSKTSTYSPKNTKFGASTTVIGTEALFNKVGEDCMKIYESKGIDEVFTYINKAVKNYDINNTQAFKLKRIFSSL